MSALFGVLGLSDTERAFVSNVGQELVFEAINTVLGYHNEDVAAATRLFVKANTEKFKMRFLSPGSGMISPVADLAPGPAIRRYEYWDVSFPLRGYEEAVGRGRVAASYMTLQELDAHIDAITERDIARHRERMLIALMEDTNLTWTDPIHGSLTIRRLANTDGATYPVLPGAAAEAEDNHYIDAGYAVAAIADANNPVVTLRDEIIEHFDGRQSGGEDIVYLHGSDQTAYIEALTDYDQVPDRFVDYGQDTDLAQMLAGMPGRLHGRTNGCWVSEWAWMPAKYGLAVHLKHPPLLRRVDPSDTGLPQGLTLVATNEDHPLTAAYYADRFGYAVANRLSAACIYINGANGGYSPPTAYAE